MRRRSTLLLALGGLLVPAALLLPGRPGPCFVGDGGTCLDDRLTGRADGYVSSIDSETPGVPLWYVEFPVGGGTVPAKVADWPPAPGGPANGPGVGATVHVAYDPAAPTTRATDADALAALRADVAAGRAGGGRTVVALAVQWAGVAVLLAGLVGVLRERRRAPRAAVPPDDARAAPDPRDVP